MNLKITNSLIQSIKNYPYQLPLDPPPPKSPPPKPPKPPPLARHRHRRRNLPSRRCFAAKQGAAQKPPERTCAAAAVDNLAAAAAVTENDDQNHNNNDDQHGDAAHRLPLLAGFLSALYSPFTYLIISSVPASRPAIIIARFKAGFNIILNDLMRNNIWQSSFRAIAGLDRYLAVAHGNQYTMPLFLLFWPIPQARPSFCA